MEATSLLAKVSNGQKDHIDLGDVMCPICLSVLIKPVKMPCDHILCMPCFEANVDKSSLNCPICRKRISVWCRKAKKEGNLVWDDLWQMIKEKFPARVEARLAGVDDVDADDIVPCLPMHQFVDTGAIKSEFDESLLKEKQEMLRKQTEEEKKSLELIKKLEQEEGEERERELERKRQQEEIDMEMARKIMESPDESPRKIIGSNQTGVIRGKENKAATVRGPLDSYFGSPEISKKKTSLSNSSALSHFTRPQKYEHKLLKPNVPNVERCPSTESIQSNNSIDAELNHFKPIRSAPLSPPKRLPDGSVLETQVIKTQPRNLANEFSSSPGPSRTNTNSRRRGAESIVKEPEVPDTPRPESISSHGEPESLFCNETLRLTLTPTPSPGLKTRSLFDPSGDSQASPVFKTSMDMDAQHLGEIMGQGYESLDPSIIEEQRRMEEQIKQQIADEKFAKLLQDDLDRQERDTAVVEGISEDRGVALQNLTNSARKRKSSASRAGELSKIKYKEEKGAHEDHNTLGLRKQPCKKCSNCIKEDCKTCVYCRDKTIYGGPNKLKQKCKYKNKCSQPIVSRDKSREGEPSGVKQPSISRFFLKEAEENDENGVVLEGSEENDENNFFCKESEENYENIDQESNVSNGR